MPTIVEPLAGIAQEAKQDTQITELQSIVTALGNLLTELQGKLDAGGEVALDAASLAALENITVTVDNLTVGLTDAELRATPVSTTESHSALVKGTVTASNAGDTIVYVPTVGKKIRLYFFGYSGGSDVTGNLLSMRLEGYDADATFDRQYLGAEGQPYARNMKAGTGYIEGGVDGRLIVNLSAAETVYVNFELEEV